jgi:hypothetical protein
MSNPFSLPWSIINRFRTYGVDLRAESPRLDSPGVGGFGCQMDPAFRLSPRQVLPCLPPPLPE